jgi:glycine cleavage system H protein
MNHPADLRYSQTHEWVRLEGDLARIGITDYAQEELGDIVYLELPKVGRTLKDEDIFGTVESVKAVSDLIAPLGGEVVQVNDSLPDAPEGVNQDPYDRGWMIVVRVADQAEYERLMSAEEYERFIAGS